jgi:hypothetical protein
VSAASSESVRSRDARLGEAPRLTAFKLAWLLAIQRRSWAAALWLCLGAAIAMPALLPLIDTTAVRSGLAQMLSQQGALTVQQDVTTLDSFNALRRDVGATVTRRTGNAMVPLAASVTVGPLYLSTVSGGPVPTQLSQQGITAAYRDHLASHVTVIAGELPPDALGGGETAVTVPQAGADQLGLRLSDRVCADVAPGTGQSRWCARVVGLWQPIDGSDPFWGQSPPRLEMAMGTSDFFELVKIRPTQGPTAGLRYWTNPSAVDPDSASALAEQTRQLTTDLRTPQRRVTTALAPSLAGFYAQQRQISTALRLFGAAIALLGLFVVALVGARFLDGRSMELAVLRARGWPAGRVWRTAFGGLLALVVCALPLGLAATVLAIAALSVGGTGISTGWLHADDVTNIGLVMSANLIGLVFVLALLAGGAVWRELEPSLDYPFRRGRPWWQRAGTAAVLGAAGIVELAFPRLPGVDALITQAPTPLPTLLALAPAVALILLTAAAIHLWPLDWTARRGSLSGSLAGWQLERSPEQHAGPTFVLVLAVAVGVFAAIGLALAPGFTGSGTQPALGSGLRAGLLVGAVVAVALALAAFGLHFRSIVRRRFDEYGGLFAHGLTMTQVIRSVAAEQLATVVCGLVVGTILGLALAFAALPLVGAPTSSVTAAGATVGVCLMAILVAVLTVGAAARRTPPSRVYLDVQGQA